MPHPIEVLPQRKILRDLLDEVDPPALLDLEQLVRLLCSQQLRLERRVEDGVASILEEVRLIPPRKVPRVCEPVDCKEESTLASTANALPIKPTPDTQPPPINPNLDANGLGERHEHNMGPLDENGVERERTANTSDAKSLWLKSTSNIEANRSHHQMTTTTLSTLSGKSNGSALRRQESTSEALEKEAALKVARRNLTQYRSKVSATESMFAEPTNVERFFKQLEKLVSSSVFETICGIAVVLNALLVGAEVQHAVTTLANEATEYMVMSYFFCFLFTGELILRILAHRWDFVWDPDQRYWNVLDTAVVTLSLTEVAVEIARQGTAMDLSSFGVFRTARILKVIRLARMVRILRFAHDLRILLLAITCTLKQLFWAMMLLSVIIYMFAIVFTQAVADFLRVPQGFETRADMTLVLARWFLHAVPTAQKSYEFSVAAYPWSICHFFATTATTAGLSSRTLFEAISGGVSWHEPLLSLANIGQHWAMFFMAYIAFTFFAVLNVVTGVFCNSAIEAAALDHEMVIQSQMSERTMYTKRFVDLFNRLDTDFSGTITVNEFQKHLDDPHVQNFLASLDLSIQDAWLFFKMLDVDGTHEVDCEEFISGCMALRGHAKNFDIKCVMYENKMLIQRVRRIIDLIERGALTEDVLMHVVSQQRTSG